MIRPPSKIELMSFADGELDDDRAREIELWLEGEAGDSAFVDQIVELGAHVRDEVAPGLSAGASFDVADAVMAAIDAERQAGEVQAAAEPARPPSAAVLTPMASASEARGAKVVPMPARAHASSSHVRAGKGILLATFAAAAALLLWLNREGEQSAHDTTPVEPTVVASAGRVYDDEASMGDGTEVERIDFGQRGGAIFYVAGPAKTATTVVWINDDEATP